MKTMYIVKLENGMIVPMNTESDMVYSPEKNCFVCNFNNEFKGMKFEILMAQKIRKCDNFNDFWLMFRAGLEEGKRMFKESQDKSLDNSILECVDDSSKQADLADKISSASGRSHSGFHKSGQDAKNTEMMFWR